VTTPFLIVFATAMVHRLEAEDLIVYSGSKDDAALFVANWLHTKGRKSGSLISAMADALLACPQVDELFADDTQLKRLVDDLAA
jgi:hypothetical protein